MFIFNTYKGAILPRFCCLNARSLNKKIDDLAAFMSVNEVHIAAVTESWLTDEVQDDQISIGGRDRYQQLQCVSCIAPLIARCRSRGPFVIISWRRLMLYAQNSWLWCCDFNHLNIQDLVRSHQLNHVVSSPARRDVILDYIITNLQSFYRTPVIFAPLGSSDHDSIMWTPKDTFDNRTNTCVKCSVRRYPESGLNCFGLWAGLNEWFHGLGPSPSTNDLV